MIFSKQSTGLFYNRHENSDRVRVPTQVVFSNSLCFPDRQFFGHFPCFPCAVGILQGTLPFLKIDRRHTEPPSTVLDNLARHVNMGLVPIKMSGIWYCDTCHNYTIMGKSDTLYVGHPWTCLRQ